MSKWGWRYFQTREFGGLYSLVFNLDKTSGTEVYEHPEYIDLEYDEAVRISREYEEKYHEEVKIAVEEQNWELLPLDISDWVKVN